jgi:hypothetical protein
MEFPSMYLNFAAVPYYLLLGRLDVLARQDITTIEEAPYAGF